MDIQEISSQSKPVDQADGGASQRRRQQIVAMALVVVVVLGAAAFGVWKLAGNRPPDEPLVDVGGGRFNIAQQPREGIRRTGNTHTLRAANAVMVASQKDGAWTFSYRYQPAKYSAPSHTRFLTAKYQSMALKLTDEQKKALNSLPAYVSGMSLSDDDRKLLESQWAEYVAAGDKSAAERKLIDSLKQVGERSIPATLADGDAYINKIKAILTPEQNDILENPKK